MTRTVWLLCVALAAVVVLGVGSGCPGKSSPEGAVEPAGKSAGIPTPSSGEKIKLRVYVPCGMIIPVKAVIAAFEKEHPKVDVDGAFDNAIVLAKRIAEKGEKADVFVSPGTVEIGRLEKAGLVDASTAKAVGTFDLVVIVQKGNPLGIKTPEDLKKCKTISTPDAELNSVGVSGKEALTKLGLWESLQNRMIPTQHAIESHTMVAGGKSDAGIAYRNCPLETNPEKLSKSKVEIAFDFDPGVYTKQQCLIAAMKDTQVKEAAAQFVKFFTSPAGLKLLAENGMTGCLTDVAIPPNASPSEASPAPTGNEAVEVRAFYPGNEDHAKMKKMILDLPKKYPGKVRSEFIDFTSDEGFTKWQDAGLTCGAILINNEQTWTYEKGGKPVEVTFKMREGGEWTQADLIAVIEKIIKEKSG